MSICERPIWDKQKWYKLPQRIETPLGIGKVRKRRLNPLYSTSHNARYEGIIQDIAHVHKVVTDHDTDKGHIDRRDSEGNLITQQSTHICGRTKQVNNKKAQGEARRKQSQAIVEKINVKTRAYYRAKYGSNL